ncbi:MAG: FKBP-type peptidyl-prolyl cis-trans isomerase [Maribacter sp.]|nr:FKBP-type peptidyl-prolyl cis-trans isomerase [Maribacter sp.]
MKRVFLLFVMVSAVWSCKKDSNTPEAIPPKLLSEVSVEDDVTIKSYLQTHFYNYEEFANPPADFDYKIRIDTIAGANADKTPMMSQVTPKTVLVSSGQFALNANEVDVPSTFYYLSAREGIGEQLTVADSAYVRYEGSLLDGTIFDGSTDVPIWFDLARIQSPQGGARGFSEGTSKLKAGGAAIVNNDGTFTVEGYGVGFMIFPSTLGYFNFSQSAIPAYSPLIFKVEVFAANQTDHDRDGIPSILEYVNGNGYLYDDNTDEADEIANRSTLYVNFLDADDDGDGKSTLEEISDGEGNIIIPYPDTNGNGIPNYLDPNK